MFCVLRLVVVVVVVGNKIITNNKLVLNCSFIKNKKKQPFFKTEILANYLECLSIFLNL